MFCIGAFIEGGEVLNNKNNNNKNPVTFFVYACVA